MTLIHRARARWWPEARGVERRQFTAQAVAAAGEIEALADEVGEVPQSLHPAAKTRIVGASAAQVAIALKARRLVFMSDVPGLLENPNNPDTVISHLRVEKVAALKKSGVIDKGMIPKADSAVAAIKSGVEKVSFVDGRVPHASSR